jgi:hypothetical protein
MVWGAARVPFPMHLLPARRALQLGVNVTGEWSTHPAARSEGGRGRTPFLADDSACAGFFIGHTRGNRGPYSQF